MMECFACGSNEVKDILLVDGFTIRNCAGCSTGRIDDVGESMVYEDYGSFLTDIPAWQIENRVRPSAKKRIFFSILNSFVRRDFTLLDLGGGAGFFAKTALNCGVSEVFLVEPSDHLRRFAIDILGLTPRNVSRDLSKVPSNSVDVITMLDVIEHVPAADMSSFLGEVSRVLRRGGVVLGKTPNYRSLNILLGGVKDPVVSPPSHCIYFTRSGLSSLFRNTGWSVKLIFGFGLSHNLFFRPAKTIYSWVEVPKSGFERVAARLVKLVFSLGGMLAVVGMGYHLGFIIKKPKKASA